MICSPFVPVIPSLCKIATFQVVNDRILVNAPYSELGMKILSSLVENSKFAVAHGIATFMFGVVVLICP
jgi:hypothetical protein